MTPTLLKSLDIDEETKSAYLKSRGELLAIKDQEVDPSFLPELRDYQKQDILFLSKLKSSANFNEQRLGKTVETLTVMKLRNENNGIIIAPKSTLSNWLEEFKKWHGGEAMIVGSPMTPEKRQEIYKTFKGTLIVNYHTMSNDIEYLIKRKIESIVLDEGHRIRKHTSSRGNGPAFAKNVIFLSRRATYRHLLTGTPSPKIPQQLYGLLSFLLPTLFKAYWDFIDYYFRVEENYITNIKKVKEIVGIKSKAKEKELQEFLEIISVQRKRKDHMDWLKHIPKKEISLSLDSKSQEWYNEMETYYEIEDEGVEVLNDLTKILRLRQIGIDPRLIGIDHIGVKTHFLLKYREKYPEHNIVIASTFTSYLELLKEHHFKDALMITGKVTTTNRGLIQKEFNEGKANILLVNLEAFKEGTKAHGADVMIVTDLSFVEGDNQQLFDRIVPTTKALAEGKNQEILILETDTLVDNIIKDARKNEWSQSEIINRYHRDGR